MPKPLRLLIVEGNNREGRDRHLAHFGLTPSGSYAATVQGLEREAVVDICLPADEGAKLPDGLGLASYDGIFLTGSGLHIYHDDPAITRQIDLMRAVYASGTPCFGSCWGLQVGSVAAGGTVTANPKGREVGFARRITPTAAGAAHPLLAGRPASFDAPAVHLDVVAVPPGDVTLLASNALTGVQAAEIRHEGGTFWGVQYHPEFSLREIAAILKRLAGPLVAEGFRRDEAEAARYAAELAELDADPSRRDLAWAHGLDDEVLDERRRLTEIRNFIDHRVKPVASARGRH